MNISIGADHAGLEYKKIIIEQLEKLGHTLINHGTNTEVSVDYPDYVHPLALAMKEGKSDWGILICGSGNGVAMTANKHPHIRAALCWTTKLAMLARQHNHANVLCIPARFISPIEALQLVEAF